MVSSSRGMALLFAFALSILTVISLSLLSEASFKVLLIVAGLTFFLSLLLLSVALEMLLFKKMETMQKNDTFRREFVADISHELKTPIFAAQGYVHTLLDGAIEDRNVRYKFLKRAAKSLKTLDKLVQDLLTLNQMESGVVKFHFENFDLKDLILELIEQLENKADKRNVLIRFYFDKEKTYRTSADKEKISRAIQNLLANAIKYNHQGGEVSIHLKAKKKILEVEIKDNGKGIPQEDLARIFERFYRVEKSRSREKGGTGLGLAIVKHILEGHKSTIRVSSTLGKGSTFSFTLPLAYAPKTGRD